MHIFTYSDIMVMILDHRSYMRGIYLLKVNNKSSLKAQEKTFIISQ